MRRFPIVLACALIALVAGNAAAGVGLFTSYSTTTTRSPGTLTFDISVGTTGYVTTDPTDYLFVIAGVIPTGGTTGRLAAGSARGQLSGFNPNWDADWSVRYELMDGAILQMLCDKIVAGGASRGPLATRFGQLLSFVMQRYIKGQGDAAIKPVSLNYLASVLIETEEK